MEDFKTPRISLPKIAFFVISDVLESVSQSPEVNVDTEQTIHRRTTRISLLALFILALPAPAKERITWRKTSPFVLVVR